MVHPPHCADPSECLWLGQTRPAVGGASSDEESDRLTRAWGSPGGGVLCSQISRPSWGQFERWDEAEVGSGALRGEQEDEKGEKQVGDGVGSEAGQGAGWGPEELDLHPGSGKLGDERGLGSWRDPSRNEGRAAHSRWAGGRGELGRVRGGVGAAGWAWESGLSGRGCRHRACGGLGSAVPGQARS